MTAGGGWKGAAEQKRSQKTTNPDRYRLTTIRVGEGSKEGEEVFWFASENQESRREGIRNPHINGYYREKLAAGAERLRGINVTKGSH